MEIDIYRTYKFDFDPDVYLKAFRKALIDSDVNKPALFYQLLKEAGINGYDYETVKSYFYGRRVPPLNVFIATCKKLNLSANQIAFPDSILDPKCNRDITCCEEWFRNVFYPYNYSDEEDTFEDLHLLFSAEIYQNDVDTIARILSKYNYLIQKYHSVAVSVDEFEQILVFTGRYIIDRQKDTETKPEQIMQWIHDCQAEDFMKAFYDKYTIGFYTRSCCSLLRKLSKAIPEKYIVCAAQLLPEQDRFGEV